MNLLIIGHRQHGKTEVGHLLAKMTGRVAIDSSRYALEHVVYPQLKDKYGYTSPDECHADRDAHRQEWFELIEAFNEQPDNLTKAILSEASIYIGMRSRMEFEGSKHHFDHVIWVDAAERKPLESSDSMKLTQEDADYVLDNNGPHEDLAQKVALLVIWLVTPPNSGDHTPVYDIAPEHHIARGIFPEYVMERLIRMQERDTEHGMDEQTRARYLAEANACDSPIKSVFQDSDFIRENFPEASDEEARAGTSTDRPMSPAHFKDTMDSGYVAGIDLAQQGGDITVSHEHAMGSIVAADLSDYEVSFDNLQRRIAEWADGTFGKAPHEFRFERLKQELDEVLQDPQDPIEWADAMMPLFHGALVEGFTMTDILKACYEKLNRLQRREYTQDENGNWVYHPKPGYTITDIK